MLDYENNGFIFISNLTDYLKALEVSHSINYLSLNAHFFTENVSSIVKEVLKVRDITKEKLDLAFQGLNKEEQVISTSQAMQLFTNLGCELSYWETLSIMEHVKAKMNVINSEDTRNIIEGKVLYAWLYLALGPDIPFKGEENYDIEERDYVIRTSTPQHTRPLEPRGTKEVRDVSRSPKASIVVEEKLRASGEKLNVPQKEDEHDQSMSSIGDIASFLNRKPPGSPTRPESQLKSHEQGGSRSPYREDQENQPENLIKLRASEVSPPQREAEKLIERHEEKVHVPEVEKEKEPAKKAKLIRKLMKHVLRFNVKELSDMNLGPRHDGDLCAVKYVFPSTQDEIESNAIEYKIDNKSKPNLSIMIITYYRLSCRPCIKVHLDLKE